MRRGRLDDEVGPTNRAGTSELREAIEEVEFGYIDGYVVDDDRRGITDLTHLHITHHSLVCKEMTQIHTYLPVTVTMRSQTIAYPSIVIDTSIISRVDDRQILYSAVSDRSLTTPHTSERIGRGGGVAPFSQQQRSTR